MKKWEILHKIKNQKRSSLRDPKIKIDEIVSILLENRGLRTKKEIDQFLNPKLENVTSKNVGIDEKNLNKALKRIEKSIKKREQIIIFGDYDVDGISGAAILWETLNKLGAKVLPYIPHRIEEGYGLSVKGIENLTHSAGSGQISRPKDDRPLAENIKLIITVDNGIAANDAVKFANENGIDVIITDHHVPGKKLPKAYAIVHTTKLCGAGVAYLLAQEFARGPVTRFPPASAPSATPRSNSVRAVGSLSSRTTPHSDHLELVALASIADLVPLTGSTRTLVKYGLEALRKTQRVGLLELFRQAAIDKNSIGVYEVGHIISPRLNAMGRLESAMDSLRLICTKDKTRAQTLAFKLGSTNRERQKFTEEALRHARGKLIQINAGKPDLKSLIFIAHESYQQGVIGLVAGKLAEEYYLPSIVVSKGEIYSKASARSIQGFNIIEFIRGASDLLVDAGGHPMAAGFTVETQKLLVLQKKLEELALKQITGEMLTQNLKIDCFIELSAIDYVLYKALQKLAPFGMGNPMPTFASEGVVIEEMRLVGNGNKHIKFKISNLKFQIEGIAFGMGHKATEFHIGDKVDIAYTIDQDTWNGNKKLQLKIKDLGKTTSR